MLLNLKHYLILSSIPLLLFSCSKEDDDNGPSEQSERYATFDISGGLDGYYVGENALISVNTQPESGTVVDWSATRPADEEPFWRLDFTSTEGANEELVPGTYTLGNIDDLDAGNADFAVFFQVQDNSNGFTSLWGGLGAAQGTMTVTEVQPGFFDNGTRDLVLGTFEFSASDNDIEGVLGQEPLEPIVVTNGEFRAKMGSF